MARRFGVEHVLVAARGMSRQKYSPLNATSNYRSIKSVFSTYIEHSRVGCKDTSRKPRFLEENVIVV